MLTIWPKQPEMRCGFRGVLFDDVAELRLRRAVPAMRSSKRIQRGWSGATEHLRLQTFPHRGEGSRLARSVRRPEGRTLK